MNENIALTFKLSMFIFGFFFHMLEMYFLFVILMFLQKKPKKHIKGATTGKLKQRPY